MKCWNVDKLNLHNSPRKRKRKRRRRRKKTKRKKKKKTHNKKRFDCFANSDFQHFTISHSNTARYPSRFHSICRIFRSRLHTPHSFAAIRHHVPARCRDRKHHVPAPHVSRREAIGQKRREVIYLERSFHLVSRERMDNGGHIPPGLKCTKGRYLR